MGIYELPAAVIIYLGFALILMIAATRIMRRAGTYGQSIRDLAERAKRRERERHDARRLTHRD